MVHTPEAQSVWVKYCIYRRRGIQVYIKNEIIVSILEISTSIKLELKDSITYWISQIWSRYFRI